MYHGGLPALCSVGKGLVGVGDDPDRGTYRVEQVSGTAALLVRGALDGPQLQHGLVLPCCRLPKLPDHGSESIELKKMPVA